jgi:RNase P subunit RPR2
MTTPTLGATERWRCSACGNLTRFDVERKRHTRDFVHVDLAGEQVVEEVQVISESVVVVKCRWCGSTDIEAVARPDQ